MDFVRMGIEFVGRIGVWGICMFFLFAISHNIHLVYVIIIFIGTSLWALLPFIDYIIINYWLIRRKK